MFCNADTIEECLSLNLFGCNNMPRLDRVTEETCLFLYNYSTKELHGKWKCNGTPSWQPNSPIW